MKISLYADADTSSAKAEEIAEAAGFSRILTMPVDELFLHLTKEGLRLERDGLFVMGDFDAMKRRLKRGNLSGEMLVKAMRLKDISEPYMIDATAGMGEDSLLLAAAGFRIDLYEYDPVIAALLSDALSRAQTDPALSEAVGRMKLFQKDSVSAMQDMTEKPDAIYLDPMFPGRKKSGLVGKKFQLLQQLEKPCDNEEELLAAALRLKPKKVVVKRPLKGPFLAGRKPSYSLAGKAIRYDVIMP